MPTATALDVARSYHAAWTAGDLDRAAALLDDDVAVEVPLNDYPTKASFLAAVQAFGGLATDVRTLSALGSRDEAMLLYDMDVQGLGTLRVVEHFAVAGGRIARLRQVHDTHPIRTAQPPGGDHYRAEVAYPAAPEAVYEALATPAGEAGWWSSAGEAAVVPGGRVRLAWAPGDFVEFRVEVAERPRAMRWTCVAQHDANLPQADEWVGTVLAFDLDPAADGTLLRFEHVRPDLSCRSRRVQARSPVRPAMGRGAHASALRATTSRYS